ncbi:MAG: hypothetical protein J3Q66DRAFT_385684 [Benniella sp.]|nr:MAG: hypothetical protein J3Q66DRAFT_385684 [Benniella sp.]
MDTNRATAIDRALALPEIVALIVLHQYPADILACSAVSRSLRASFAPFVWQDLCYGPPWPSNRDAPSRCIYAQRLPDIVAHAAVQNRIEAQNQIVATFKDIAPRIRTLIINNHESIFPLQLGAACSQLQSLSISGIPTTEVASAHWVNCKTMMRRNRHHLQSLSLFSWNYDFTRLQPGQPNWNPILGCTKSWNLRSLSLVRCRIRGRHMAAFWVICSRLERLILDRVQLHIDLPHSPPSTQAQSHVPSRGGYSPIQQALDLLWTTGDGGLLRYGLSESRTLQEIHRGGTRQVSNRLQTSGDLERAPGPGHVGNVFQLATVRAFMDRPQA